MNDREHFEDCISRLLGIIALLALVFFLLTSCRSTRHTATHDTVFVNTERVEYRWKHDSIYTDRWHDRWLQGDTVYMRDSLVCYRWHTLTDTLRLHDSVHVSKSDTTTVEVAKPLSKFVKWQIAGFWLLLAGLLLAVAWWVFKKFYLHR